MFNSQLQVRSVLLAHVFLCFAEFFFPLKVFDKENFRQFKVPEQVKAKRSKHECYSERIYCEVNISSLDSTF